jgi:hypothetical protein
VLASAEDLTRQSATLRAEVDRFIAEMRAV